MSESEKKSVGEKYRHIHCPACGGTDVKLVGGKGRFIGKTGGMIFQHICKFCDSVFTLVITGDEFFPDRGFAFVQKDLGILFGKSA